MFTRGLSWMTFARLSLRFLLLSVLRILARGLVVAGILATLALVYWSHRPFPGKILTSVLVFVIAALYLIYCGYIGLPGFAEFRRGIAAKTGNPDRLIELAKCDRNARVRAEAVKRLTDQALLEAIARNDDSVTVRSAAASALASSETLLKILVESRSFPMWQQCTGAVIRATQASEAFQQAVSDTVCQTEFAEELLRLPVCKHCFGYVEHREWQEWQWNFSDPFPFMKDREETMELVYYSSYRCSACKEEATFPFSVPFAFFLTKQAVE